MKNNLKRGMIVKIYITSGTYDFLIKIKHKHSNEIMLLMQNNENTVLIHESERKTVFSMPRSFEVIESFGLLNQNAEYAVMTNIPLSEEEIPLFEYRFKNSHALLQNQPGFIALRILRPLKANMYVILTLWQSEKSFKDWQTTPSYQSFFQDTNSASKSLHLFSGDSFTKYYFITKEEK